MACASAQAAARPARVYSQPYCAGSAIITDADLYESPPCDLSSYQVPAFSPRISYAAVELRALPFCCKANYTALVPAGTDVFVKDAEARFMFGFAERFVARYDCLGLYPFHTCEPCLNAYRTWLCSQAFPMRCSGSRDDALQVCTDVCLEVQRKCPAEMGFVCPLDEGTNDRGDGQYAEWRGGSQAALFGRGGCNPMHYTLGPGSPFSSRDTATGRSMVAALLCVVLLVV